LIPIADRTSSLIRNDYPEGGNAMMVEETTQVSSLAGKPAEPEMLVNVPKLVTATELEELL
jgi:hypothetical protein